MADKTGPPRSKYPPPSPTTGYPPGPPQPQSQPQPPPQPQPQPQPGYQQPQPGFRPDAARPPAQPPARWPLTIISFLCFFLVGIIAMYFSAQVSSRWRAGNTVGAEKASQMALLWGIVGIVIGLTIFFAALGSESGSSF
jgi:Interferon-induced transmembrane protein